MSGSNDATATRQRASIGSLVCAALTLVTCSAAWGADPATDPPAFQPGDISIGEPIALPFDRAPGDGPRTLPNGPAGPRRLEAVAPQVLPGNGWLGLVVAEASTPGRFAVAEVAADGPAAAAGIQAGDEVRAINGLPLRTSDDVSQALTAIAPGQQVRLAIAKGEQVSDVALEAIPRPAAARSWAGADAPSVARQALAANATEGGAQAPLAAAPLTTAVNAQAPPTQPLPAPQFSLPAAVPDVAAAPPVMPAQPAVTAPQVVATPPAATVPPAVAAPPAAVTPPAFTTPPAVAAAPAFAAAPDRPVTPGRYAAPPADAAVFEPAEPAPSAMSRDAMRGRTALGVRTVPIDPSLQARFRLPEASGAYVIGVVGDLPASKAGVPPGSVIVAIDNRPVRSPDELTRLVTAGPVGRPVPLEYVLPGGTPRRADVVLQTLEQPLEEALVGGSQPTVTDVPALQPQPTPATARRPIAAEPDTASLRDEIRRLRARLDTLEQRLEAADR
ncbi:MAG: PDZ domain-containing protein [Planctomycetota bacterium]